LAEFFLTQTNWVRMRVEKHEEGKKEIVYLYQK
jgi:hypothetical protein